MKLLNRATYWPGWEPTHRALILWALGKRRPLWITAESHPEKYAELLRRRAA